MLSFFGGRVAKLLRGFGLFVVFVVFSTFRTGVFVVVVVVFVVGVVVFVVVFFFVVIAVGCLRVGVFATRNLISFVVIIVFGFVWGDIGLFRPGESSLESSSSLAFLARA